jgi:hypothetical protein
MTPEELFTAALGLGRQWRVAKCRFAGEPKHLELRLEHVPGERFACPNSRLLLMVEGRSAEALRAFAEALREHGADPS